MECQKLINTATLTVTTIAIRWKIMKLHMFKNTSFKMGYKKKTVDKEEIRASVINYIFFLKSKFSSEKYRWI